MLVIPAIDLKNGKVVRLIQGSYEQVTIYSEDPVEMAKSWQAQGAERLHIVDLDGAKAGQPVNIDVLEQIVKDINIPVQLGGGLRRREDIAKILNIGVKWAILGTKACEDLDFVKEIISEFGEKIIVSIDVKDKKVATRGWTKTCDIEDVDLIKRMQKLGVESFIYTDISRDGTLSGFNVGGIKRVLEDTGAALIYSGGISSIDDLRRLKVLEEQGLLGIIIGKALYENKINLTEAKALLGDKS